MSRKIKLHTFNVLFQLFAYLADKTGGWRVFVRPKLLLGSLIVGLGLTSCSTKTENRQNIETTKKSKESIQPKSSKEHLIKSSRNIKSITQPKDTAESTTTCYITIEQSDILDKNGIYNVAEQSPKFPGGDTALMNFLEKQIKYPSNESLSNINGKVICGFIVNKDGSISDITIYRSLDPILDSIAVKAIKAMPKFIPGKQNGLAVRVQYTLPIIFRTQE
jgi:TonB family protein